MQRLSFDLRIQRQYRSYQTGRGKTSSRGIVPYHSQDGRGHASSIGLASGFVFAAMSSPTRAIRPHPGHV